MKCPMAKQMLVQYLSGALDNTPEAKEFEEHVQRCAYCKGIVADKRQTLKALISAVDAPPQVNLASKKNLITDNLKQKKMLLIGTVGAFVLLLVGYVFKPGELLGEKLSSSAVATENSTQVKTETPVVTKNTIEEQSETSAAIYTAEEPNDAQKTIEQTDDKQETVTKKEETKQETKQETNKTSATQSKPNANTKSQQSTQKRQKTNQIEVFDENGRRIGSTFQIEDR